MATYTWDVTSAECAALLPHYTIGVSSKPTSTQVTAWISGRAADVNLIIESYGQDPSSITTTSDDTLYQAVRIKIQESVARLIHLANQERSTTLAERYDADWQAYLEWLDTRLKAMGGSAPRLAKSSMVDTRSRSVSRSWSITGSFT